MSILAEQPQIVNAEAFAAGLERALRSVVRILVADQPEQAICTGWMLTPRIVVVPGYISHDSNRARRPPEMFSVQAMSNGRPLWRDVAVEAIFTSPADDVPEMGLGLLRLQRRRRAPRLDFSPAPPELGAFMAVLSFPAGGTRAAVSFGRFAHYAEKSLDYTANTEFGSGGAPVFDERWMVYGMHLMKQAGEGQNSGLNRAGILRLLRPTAFWPEIAEYHHLADVDAGQRSLAESAPAEPVPVSAAFVRAAVRLTFRPTFFSEADRALLESKVIDPKAARWTLRPDLRQKIIQSVGDLRALRAKAPRTATTPGQRAIARILAGPPYVLHRVRDDELSWWIQAVRWFAGVIPELPSAAEVNKILQRRRVRGKLDAIAGAHFVGRKSQLKEMRRWFAEDRPPPLSVSGIGGIGKSALIAQFAASLPRETVLLWLDFDRADLAPDDAVSIVRALGEQLSVQMDGFVVPEVTVENWRSVAGTFAGQLQNTGVKHPPLLVLDSFEVAQYAERYQELWPVLGEIVQIFPGLRVIISGRAPIAGPTLQGRSARSVRLPGLSPGDTRAWLKEHKIRGKKTVDSVVRQSRGLPYILHLARLLVESGGKVSDLPKKLPPKILAGFLYGRILDRVQRPDLKELAMGALVLRRMTQEMIKPMFEGLITFPAGEPQAWFADLSREAALVDGTNVLRLRPEVRSAALELLENEQPELVRAIDERAAKWYVSQDRHDKESAAELVYHCLRLGDIEGAGQAWRDDCGAYLQYAEDDLLPKPRAWLRARLGSGAVEVSVDHEAEMGAAWEQEAAERVRNANARGHERVVPEILHERAQRSPGSPLLFLEAYRLRSTGEKEEALKLLESERSAPEIIERERALLRALLLSEMKRNDEADRVLGPLSDQQRWDDRKDGAGELAAVCAARVRLAIDLEAELELERHFDLYPKDSAIRDVSPIDVLLPSLSERILRGRSRGSDRSWSLAVAHPDQRPDAIFSYLEEYRNWIFPTERIETKLLRHDYYSDFSPMVAEGSQLSPQTREVLRNGWRRWGMFCIPGLFAPAAQILREDKLSAFQIAIVGAYTAFTGMPGLVITLENDSERRSLDDLLMEAFWRNRNWLTRFWLSAKMAGPPSFQAWIDQVSRLRSGDFHRMSRDELRECAILLRYAGPDPLELLVDRFAGKGTSSYG